MKNFVIGMGVILAAAGMANAQVWNESGDAGDLVGTAQVVAGSGALTIINGALDASDVDMYQIHIDDPALFLAQHTSTFSFDSQMWLFNTSGQGIAFRDDDASGLRSSITGLFVPGVGDYLLAISGYDRDALDAGGLAMWSDTPFGTERAPDGPGAAGVVSSWTGTVAARGSYEIALRGASFVPAPGAAALLGLGGLVVGRRRR